MRRVTRGLISLYLLFAPIRPPFRNTGPCGRILRAQSPTPSQSLRPCAIGSTACCARNAELRFAALYIGNFDASRCFFADAPFAFLYPCTAASATLFVCSSVCAFIRMPFVRSYPPPKRTISCELIRVRVDLLWGEASDRFPGSGIEAAFWLLRDSATLIDLRGSWNESARQ